MNTSAAAMVPPLSPVAVSNGHRKRRHSQMSAENQPNGHGRYPAETKHRTGGAKAPVDSAHATLVPSPPSDDPESDSVRPTIDESEDSDVEITSSVEDLVEQAEVEPYSAFLESETCLDFGDIMRLRARLMEVGPVEFLQEELGEKDMDMRLLGTAFGIDPLRTFRHNDHKFLSVLTLTVHRIFMKRRKLVQFNTIDDAAELLRKSSKIMVITGAGISTSLGIPDFRSKEGGFYTMLLKEGYDDPEAVFDIETFDLDPRLFYKLAGNILPDMKKFSPTHAFIRLLQDKGKLQRNYSQNIDALEQAAGIRDGLLVQCHGSFATATCRKNREHHVKGSEIFPDIKAQQVAYCQRCKVELAEKAKQHARKKSNGNRRREVFEDSDDESNDLAPGVMKPDITFFGEQLPSTFFDLFTEEDSEVVDLVIVIGTSLKVAPVSEMPNHLPAHVPHIYISREPIEHVNFDIQLLGNCDDVVVELCRRAGWTLKHDMIPDRFRVRVEPYEESSYRWKVTARPPKEVSTGPRLDVPGALSTPSRTVSPARDPMKIPLKPKDDRSRTSSPSRSANGQPKAAENAKATLVISPNKPTFRPILGSPSHRPASTPTLPPIAQRPIPGSPLRQPNSTSALKPQPYRPIPGSPSRVVQTAVHLQEPKSRLHSPRPH